VSKYEIEFQSRALKELKATPQQDVQRILGKIQKLENGMHGDIKKLTNFTPEYRLRIGDYRVLFELNDTRIIIHRIKHRKKVYQ